MKAQKIFLIAAALGLVPIALSYGIDPQGVLGQLFGLEFAAPNGVHIMRAMMFLYLGLASFWVMGARNEKLTIPALYSLIVFMLSLAAGRLVSLLVDGMPHWILVAYLGLEVAFGIVGIVLLKRAENQSV